MNEKTSFIYNTLPPGYDYVIDSVANVTGWESGQNYKDGFNEDWEICESAWEDFVDKVVVSSRHPFRRSTCGPEESVVVEDLELHCVEDQSACITLDDGYGLGVQLCRVTPYRSDEHRAEVLARFAGFVLGLYGMTAAKPESAAILAQPALASDSGGA